MSNASPSTAYGCVYRHPVLSRSDLRLVQRSAQADASVARYLARYQEPRSVLDWGDDPSFFCADETGRSATWGVCRADVRAKVRRGDFVVFICARTDDGRHWDYYLTGVGTVAEAVAREERSKSRAFEPYIGFFNTLGQMEGERWVQHEVVGNHDDWEKRMASPYIVFDPHPALTRFDIQAPQHLATYRKTQDLLERWDEHPTARRVQGLLGLPTDVRGLRTTNPYIPHAKLRLDSRRLMDIRDAVIGVVESVKSRGGASQ